MTIVFWFLLLLLIFILSIVFYFKMKTSNAEHFSQLTDSAKQRLDTTFGQGKCDILKSSSLSTLTQVTADSYLDSGRLKSLKSTRPVSNSDSLSTCYINNDISKNEQDYFMSGRSCSKSDFQNIPFIKDVYADNTAQTTTTTTPNKCVFKIDPSKVDDKNLTDFWNGVRQSECIQMNRYVIDANQHLRDKYDSVTKTVDTLRSNVDNQVKNLEKQQQAIALSNGIIDGLRNNLNTSNAVLKTLVSDIGTLQNDIYQYSCNCAYTTANVSEELNSCQVSRTSIKEKYDPVSTTLSNLKTDMASFQIRFDGLNNDIQIKSGLLGTLQSTYNDRFAAYETLNNAYSKCMSSNETCHRNVATCESNLGVHTTYYELQKANSNVCFADLTTCRGNLAICNTSTTALNTSITNHTRLFNDCMANKTACIRDDSAEQSKIQGYTQDYAYVQKYYDYKTCTPLETELATLKAQEADLLARCQRAKDQSDKSATDLTSTINNITDQMNNSLDSCHKSAENKSKLPPIPACPRPDDWCMEKDQFYAAVDCIGDGLAGDLICVGDNQTGTVFRSAACSNVWPDASFGGCAAADDFKKLHPSKPLVTYFHYVFNFHWTRNDGGWNGAKGESISTVSLEDAKASLLAIMNPYKPGGWNQFGWNDEPHAYSDHTNKYSYQLVQNSATEKEGDWQWLVRTGGAEGYTNSFPHYVDGIF